MRPAGHVVRNFAHKRLLALTLLSGSRQTTPRDGEVVCVVYLHSSRTSTFFPTSLTRRHQEKIFPSTPSTYVRVKEVWT